MMSFTVSYDAEEVECPYCEASNCLTDATIDGWLEKGATFECQACKQEVEIDDVDWEPTIYCKPTSKKIEDLE